MEGAGEIPSIDYKGLFAKVRENRDRLDACPRHLFSKLYIEERALGQKAKCDKCGGSLALEYVNQYVRGYEAAGKPGNDIVPGWKEPGKDVTPTPKRSFFELSE